MDSQNIKIEITQDVTPEVIQGLKLYARLASMDVCVDDWLYWFEKNPYGSGLHGLVMHREKVVGFYALIPTEMRLGGNILIGGKGEFLAVEPDYRGKCVSGSRMPLAFDLVKTVHREALRYDMEAVIIVADGPAALCHLFSGAKAFEFPCRHFFTFFRSPKHEKSSVKRALIRSGVFSIPRAWLTISSAVSGNRKDRFTRVKELKTDDFYRSEGNNRLVCSSSKMLNFRFPDRSYVKYLTSDENRTDYLIFTRPDHKRQVILKDWSCLHLQKQEIKGIFRDMFGQCRKYKVESMHLYLPQGDQEISHASHAFCNLGFFSRKYSLKFYLYGSDSIIHSVDTCSWKLTHAYVGYV